MIIPSHRVCDICERGIGGATRFYRIKSFCKIHPYTDCYIDNKKHDICESCMKRLEDLIRKECVKNE